jgi:ubiquinone/menaquinone biosynthesis C-methylase UbiE
MLSLAEIKLFIEKLEKLKETDFQKFIDDTLVMLKDLQRIVDQTNKTQIQKFGKTTDWFRKDLAFKETNKESLQDLLLEKMIESKIFHFSKDPEARCLEIGPGYGKFSLLLRAWRNIFFAEMLPECRKHIWDKFPKEHHKYLSYFQCAGTSWPDIPTGSCNFAFSWDVFVFFEEPYIKQLLKDLWRILQPGGYGFLQYSNADTEYDFNQIKRGYWSYNNKELMTKLLEHNGFAIIEFGQFKEGANFVIFQKPGSQNRVSYKKIEIPLD